MKPDRYPLPWCESQDLPYWQVNLILCSTIEGWREWQSRKSMEVIIPKIDALFEKENNASNDQS